MKTVSLAKKLLTKKMQRIQLIKSLRSSIEKFKKIWMGITEDFGLEGDLKGDGKPFTHQL